MQDYTNISLVLCKMLPILTYLSIILAVILQRIHMVKCFITSAISS